MHMIYIIFIVYIIYIYSCEDDVSKCNGVYLNTDGHVYTCIMQGDTKEHVMTL